MKMSERCHIAGASTMPKRSNLRLGGVLPALACVAIGLIYIGDDPSATTTIIG
jgi:hypothetical protein